MAYTEDKEISGLDTIATPATDDYMILSDTSDSGRAKAITVANFKAFVEAFSSYFNKTTSTLNDISNVNAPSPTDGQLLAYDNATSQWIPNTSSTPDGNTTTGGKFEEATAAEINAGTATGGSGSRLAVSAQNLASSNYALYLPSSGQKDALAGSSGTPGAGNTYVTTDDVSSAAASGKIVRATGTALPALSAANLTNLPLVSNSGSTTKDLSAASTTQNIAHGLGRTPKIFNVIASSSGTLGSDGQLAFSLNGASISMNELGSGGFYSQTFAIRGSSGSNSDYQTAVVTADATNIILTWTKTANPTGTAYIIWNALA